MVLTTGCATHYHLFSTGAVSMTHYSSEPGETLEKTGSVNEKFCLGDKAEASQTMDIGLVDEVVTRAQAASHADFIKNVDFAMEGNCIVINGEGYRLASSKGASSSTAAPDADAAPKKKKKKKK